MILAIDASRSLDAIQKTGVEVVSDELLRALAASQPANVDIIYYTPKKISWLPESQQKIIPGHRFWTIWHLSRALHRDQPDALLAPVHALPWWLPKKTIRVIHDVSFFREPNAYSLRERTYMRLDLWRAKKFCQAIIVPTEAVKKDLVELAGFSPEKIVATGWGAGPMPVNWQSKSNQQVRSAIPAHPPSPASAATRDEQKPNRLPLEERRASESVRAGAPESHFVFFVSRVEEKKNVANLIKAFTIFRQTHPDWKLILAGKPGHGFENIQPLLNQPGVESLGYITNEQKWDFLSRASMLAIVSKEEGFAFPMLEAFQADVPVVASNIPVLREIGAGACVYAAPTDPGAIAAAFSKVADDQVMSQQLITAGHQRLAQYQWSEVAKKVWQTLQC